MSANKPKIPKSNNKLPFRQALLMFGCIPMVVAIIATVIISLTTTLNKSSGEMTKITKASMLALVNESGTGFDYHIKNSEQTLKGFASAPIVVQYLENPDDEELAKEAQKFTVNFFNQLDNWEGIYIASWESKVLTHPAEPVIGKVMREGDALKELQIEMANAEDGIYNAGIITSPASGELIVSMYAPVYNSVGKAIGYVGAGTYIANIVEQFDESEGLNLESAYEYVVSPEGIMLFHPNEEKIGNPVENEVVKGLVSKIAGGSHPSPEVVEYEYKGAMKYASYYVGDNNRYIAVVTADEDDVISEIDVIRNASIKAVIIGSIIVALIFIVVILILARRIANSATDGAKALNRLASGDISTKVEVKSNIRELQEIATSASKLQESLEEIITNVKNSSESVNGSAVTVSEMSKSSSDSCEQVNRAVDELAQGSMSIADSCTQLATEVDEMSRNCDEISEEVSSLSKASAEIQKASDEAKEHMNSALNASKKSNESANEITDIIMETNESVGEINKAIELILSIANQTNLLSLNASIEAARAGEAGRGFAVVASEISSLAAQSSESANTIQDIVARITEISQKSVNRAQEIKKIIAEQEDCINETNDKFNSLTEQVDNSIVSIKAISDKVTALDSIKNVINSNVSDLSAVSEESAASTQESTASITSIASSVGDISINSEELKNLAEQLAEQVSFFH